jgi:hypothetical protein
MNHSFENGGGGRNRIMGIRQEPCPMSKPRRERTQSNFQFSMLDF